MTKQHQKGALQAPKLDTFPAIGEYFRMQDGSLMHVDDVVPVETGDMISPDDAVALHADGIEPRMTYGQRVTLGHLYKADDEYIISPITGTVAQLRQALGCTELRYPDRKQPAARKCLQEHHAAVALFAKSAAAGIRAALATPRPVRDLSR